MYLKLKKNVKNLVPAGVLDFCLSLMDPYGFKGEYKDWKTAQKFSLGYDSDIILSKTKQALLKVKNGEAVYERDSFLFDKIEYSWPLLASLLYVASDNDNCLDLLDFGGSLGSTYYQNIGFLKSLKNLNWSIVEQPSVAECGRKYFTSNHLKFYERIEECLKENSPMVALFSGSLQYMPEPYKILDQLFQKGIRYILFDRLVVNDRRNIITVQSVNPSIYKASYPVWIFKEKDILNYLTKNNYELMADFDSLGGDFMVKKCGVWGCYKGYLFKLKRNDS